MTPNCFVDHARQLGVVPSVISNRKTTGLEFRQTKSTSDPAAARIPTILTKNRLRARGSQYVRGSRILSQPVACLMHPQAPWSTMLPQHHAADDRILRRSNSSKAGTKRALAEQQQQQEEAVKYRSYSKDADPLLLAKVGMRSAGVGGPVFVCWPSPAPHSSDCALHPAVETKPADS